MSGVPMRTLPANISSVHSLLANVDLLPLRGIGRCEFQEKGGSDEVRKVVQRPWAISVIGEKEGAQRFSHLAVVEPFFL